MTGNPYPDWNPNDWETPDYIADAMAGLLLPTDNLILEPAAGTGQICKALSKHPYFPGGVAVEKNYSRVSVGTKEVKCWQWEKADFLVDGFHQAKFDLIITNPPFSYCLEFIARSLELLKRENPDSRLLFLLPSDWNQTNGRAEQWQELDAHIHHVYQIIGRVDYLKDGIPASKSQKVKNGIPVFDDKGKPVMMSGRQCCDCVFDIRPGKKGAVVTYLN